MDMEVAAVSAEFKFVGSAGADYGPGLFTGYAAVFGNVDSHGDVIAPGAFAETLAQRKADGRAISMHVMHGFFGGDGLPIGVWKAVEEDDKGLRVHGKISGMQTETGQLHYERLRDGAFGGLSIGYKVAKDGATKADGVRHLKRLDLREISLVDSPSNALAKIDEIKRAALPREMKTIMAFPKTEAAAASLVACLDLYKQCLGGTDNPTADEREALRAHLEDALGHLSPEAKAMRLEDPSGGANLARDFSFLSNFSL